MSDPMLEAALSYAARGLCVIPIHTITDGRCTCGKPDCGRQSGKHPRTKSGLSDATTDEKTICGWWRRWPGSNIAIACAASGLLVIDVDQHEGGPDGAATFDRLLSELGPLEAPEVRTGGGGSHLYFRGPGGGLVAQVGPGVDVRSKAYVVAPPSIHLIGGSYQWCDGVSLDDVPIGELPPEWLSAMRRPAAPVAEPRAPRLATTPPGRPDATERARRYLARTDHAIAGQGGHATTFRAAVAMRIGFALDDETSLGLLTSDFNPRCVPPWSERELRHKIEQAAQYQKHPVGWLLDEDRTVVRGEPAVPGLDDAPVWEPLAAEPSQDLEPPSYLDDVPLPDDDESAGAGPAPSKRGPSKATRLVQLAHANGATFACDTAGCSFARIRVDRHDEVMPLRSAAFSGWLAALFWSAEHSAAGESAVRDAVATLQGESLAGERVETAVRVAGEGTTIWIDLADSKWRAVRIDADGWRIVERCPVWFRRPAGVLPLPSPVAGGQVDGLREFMNVADEHWPILAGWLVAALRPRGPFPVLVLIGSQGAGKSTAARFLRGVVDPNTVPLRGAPDDLRGLSIAAQNGWVQSLENLSSIAPWLSDALCTLSTGGGAAQRRLYCDTDEVLFDAQRPTIVNGIVDVVTRPDLLDRAVLVRLESIPPDRRRTEEDLHRAFNAAAPRIVGAMCDAVSLALRRWSATTIREAPRMVDFARWVTACEPVLGLADGAFMRAYSASRDEAVSVALESSPVVRPLFDLLEKGDLSGTAGDLLERLSEKATDLERRQRRWPSDATRLAAELRRLRPALVDHGFTVTSARHGKTRLWVWSIGSSPASPASAEKGHSSVQGILGVERDKARDAGIQRSQRSPALAPGAPGQPAPLGALFEEVL